MAVLDLLGVGLGAHPPAALRRLPGDVGLAAVDVGAHVGLRVGVGGVLLFPDGVGAGGAGLGLQGLLLKSGGHLRRHHPEQVVGHGQLRHRAVRLLELHHPALVPLPRGGLHRPVDGEGAGGQLLRRLPGAGGRYGEQGQEEQDHRQDKPRPSRPPGGGACPAASRVPSSIPVCHPSAPSLRVPAAGPRSQTEYAAGWRGMSAGSKNVGLSNILDGEQRRSAVV